jgi:hypothetical protein
VKVANRSLGRGKKQTVNVRMVPLALVPIAAVTASFAVDRDVADLDKDSA